MSASANTVCKGLRSVGDATVVVAAVARTEAQHQLDKLIDKKLGAGQVGDAAKGLVDGLLGN